MKKIYYICSFALSTLLLSGCSSSFLDKEPPLYLNDEDAYGSVKRIESTLLGLYASIKNTPTESLIGGKTYLAIDNRGDDLINTSVNLVSLKETYGMSVTAVSTENNTTWTTAYAAINKVNIFLEKIEGSKEILGDKFEQFKAEAQFIRAIAYYYLNNLYAMPYVLGQDAKSVPLRLKAETDLNNNNMPRSTVKQVYEQILLDLTNDNNLPKGAVSEAGVTRATKGAASMLKMRVYMAMGNWSAAIAAGEEVKGYSLTEGVKPLFSKPYYTQETIFSLPMAINNTPNTQQSLAEYYVDEKILIIDTKDGIMSKANYSLAADQRIAFKDEKNRLTKFTDEKTKLDWVPIFRYAETLLNFAECYANSTGGEAQARAYLKEVRHRSIAADEDKLDIDALSGAALKEAIYNERRIEFIGEGLRGIDIIRRGENFIKGDKITTPQSNGYIWPIPQSEVLINGDINK